MRSVYQILLVLVSLACASTAQAGLIISLLPDNDTLTIPSSGTAEINFGVTIADNGIGGTTSIQFYTILADIQSPSGKGLPSGWSVTDVTGEFAFPNSFRGFQEDI
ncbi:MAG: hypothetical protein KDA45_10195, partial [Planctomycetales bacterium]|nr:hypothetical protein [Planctomycetales bacterium]